MASERSSSLADVSQHFTATDGQMTARVYAAEEAGRDLLREGLERALA